ncbi:PilZ domain protein [Enhygromyxa salina]|uniref:PilZ domain protein n=1 Tax=Enhygromyxa salina TaxID=215803 RepID=A0A2S9YRX3_9BACT|nr:PilZ domain protein [Enhygromyxa salina]
MAVHYRLSLRRAGGKGRGTTENLSERGAMVSLDVDPPLVAGEMIELEIELPGYGSLAVPAKVRWASTVLPGMTGVEFTLPVSPVLLAHIAQLITTGIDEAEAR